ncbi:MAG: NfeD family protein [Merismopedia sp. SIO2A8]|nr:NfeD family protein [Merismopedia sp. SIO2A8]
MEDFFSNQPSYNLWLFGGLIGLIFGMFIGEPGIAAVGLAAIITAIAAISISQVAVQFIVWAILSAALAVVIRGMVPKESNELKPSTEAEVVMDIPRGYTGEVSYEGSLWKARCQISDVTIPAGEQVHVVGRRGNTLIVIPMKFPDTTF